MRFGAKKKERRIREQVLVRIQGKAIKYVARRDIDGDGRTRETVLGKNGRINVLEDAVTVVCDGKIVFHCPRNEIECHEMMSLDGAVLQGGGTTVAAYYLYHRKV